MRSLAVIPVRMAASRLPGKPLIDLAGRTVVQWVWDATVASGVFSDVVVATPDREIVDAVRAFGGEVTMTGDHASGTDRVAEVARRVEHQLVANVQGDQPFVNAGMLRALMAAFDGDPAPAMTTVATRLASSAQHADPNTVKVVLDRNGDALYFSRAPIPHDACGGAAASIALHHLGLYAFRRDFLERFSELAAGPLEKSEGLEQLRALENGYRIRVAEVAAPTIEVNTDEDLVAARVFASEGAAS